MIHKGTVFENVDGLYTGDVPTSKPESDGVPHIRWTGAKIPWQKYCEWVAFARYGKKDHQEIVLKPVYNEETKEWSELIYPQEGTAAGVSTLPDHVDVPEVEKILHKGYDVVGSFHSHPGSAFQSGTDEKDELDNAEGGLHITVGNLDKAEISTHFRMVFKGFQYPTVDVAEWIDLPITLTGLPAKLEKLILNYYLENPTKVEFPKAWQGRLIDSFPTRKNGYGAYAMNSGYGFHKLNKGASSKKKAIKKLKDVASNVVYMDDDEYAVAEDDIRKSFETVEDEEARIYRINDGVDQNGFFDLNSTHPIRFQE